MIFLVCFHQIVVEVVLGEQRGEGVRMGTRCLWDADTDNFASGYNSLKTVQKSFTILHFRMNCFFCFFNIFLVCPIWLPVFSFFFNYCMNQNWVQESILAWLWNHFHLALGSNPWPFDREPSALPLIQTEKLPSLNTYTYFEINNNSSYCAVFLFFGEWNWIHYYVLTLSVVSSVS